MVYMGSKNRIAKELIPIITKDIQQDQWYIEPFVGGCNMIDKVDHHYRLGIDNNKYLIALLQYVQNDGELPEFISKEEYLNVKENKDKYPNWYVGFIGFICGFKGMFFSGYAGLTSVANGKQRNYIKEKRNNLLKQRSSLKDLVLECKDYKDIIIPAKSIIYCDPPYTNTASYKTGDFDSDKFWEWCREKVKEGHKVFISEYNAPDDFICIWQKGINTNLGSKSKTAIEKLFIHKLQS